jgi:acyl-ACP thioesterase
VEGLAPRPAAGRVFETAVTVRFADTDPSGRLRLDALARILQDAGNDDFLDAGADPLSPWVARRSEVVVGDRWPRLGERSTLATWCGGLGGRWAERRTSLPGGVEVATLWVHLGPDGRPARVPAWFVDVWGAAAGGRTVGTRLRLGGPSPAAAGRPWALRSTDFDVMGHVNNTVPWAAVEDECARHGIEPRHVEVEWPGAIDPGDEVTLRSEVAGGRLRLWLCVAGAVRVAATAGP